MSISVTIPLDALNDPKVAKALSDLMLSLGGLSGGRAARGRISTGGTDAADLTAGLSATRRRRAAPKPPFGEGLTESQRYEAFIEGLPAPSRRFLDLIRENGTVTLSRAIDELDITVPKAIGGITGSLSRWARDRGVELPFRADKSSSGERIWVWTRSGGAVEEADRAVSKPPKKRARASRRADRRDTEAAKEDSSARDRHDDGSISPTDALSSLLEGQTDTAREFLSLLSQRGELTMSDALKSFGLKHAQAIGAVIRSFRKRAKERELFIPFQESRSRTGERMWTWTGYPVTDDADDQVRPGTGVLRRRRGSEQATPV